jgi:hypothetical protein
LKALKTESPSTSTLAAGLADAAIGGVTLATKTETARIAIRFIALRLFA